MSECKMKGFQQVLVRDSVEDKWRRQFFDYYDETSGFPYRCIGNGFKCCIPYESNEHLAGTSDPYVEPYEPKDGDFVTYTYPNGNKYVAIFKCTDSNLIDNYYVDICLKNNVEEFLKISYDNGFDMGYSERRLSTEEEKQLLLDALHKEDKDWNAEEKKIVDLKWEPKLKERFFQPYFDRTIGLFICCEGNWLNTEPQKNLYKMGWAFKRAAKKGCLTLCDKLNEAIKNVK